MSEKNPGSLSSENKERVMRLTMEVFVPHLQRAVDEAKSEAPMPEILSAASTAYSQMLDMVVGRKAAVSLLRDLATHLENLPPRER